MPPRKTDEPAITPPGPPPDSPPGPDPAPRPRGSKTGKAPTPPRSRTFAALALSEPWMLGWAELALNAGGAEEACREVKISLADFAAARGRDPGFDGLCRTLDRIADLRIMEKLRGEAMQGDPRAQALYYARVRELVLPPDDAPDDGDALPAPVAEAMISAGLAAAAALAASSAPAPAPPEARRPRGGDL